MKCPSCEHEPVKIIDTRAQESGEVVRQRRCPQCAAKFTTVERISAFGLKVAKAGDRPPEDFSRTKLRRGIEKAAAVWSLGEKDLDAILDRVVKRLRPKPNEIVSSKEIAEIVLRVLAGDRPALAITRTRFAMVSIGRTSRATRFHGVHDFIRWLEDEYGAPPVTRPVQTPSVVVKRNGHTREEFSLQKLERSIGIASKGRGSDGQVERDATAIAVQVAGELHGQAIVTSQQIAGEALKILKRRDQLAYLRYASAVKRYQSVDDFWREAFGLLES
ncbi:ATP cone domain-containing protein [Parafrankia sp. BMG5.11]|uniref:ATP cone domain-containing protein n=1 Tax=Parafrankia sp. BMG5.11 TaxID=222540 RepID=UPI0010399744|nr:ATP cone domain-containing protein [Parafrankia sp. BMG5.11]TCJ40100.1 transcriptional repressor NrdR [Parafrankia sp. BMG5.11]